MHIEYELISKPSRFFKIGRVFKTRWTEPAGSSISEDGSVYTGSSEYGEGVFTKVRFFVVIRAMQDCSLCLPLNTYNRQGTTKNRVQSQHYAVVYAQGSEPLLAPGEMMTKRPISIVVENNLEKLDPMSRLNFGRVYTVEHNLKVSKVGRIAPEHMHVLEANFLETIRATNQQPTLESTNAEPLSDQTEAQAYVAAYPSEYPPTGYGVSSMPAFDNEDGEPSKSASKNIPSTEMTVEKLDKSFKVRNTDWQTFFQIGRVFSTLWTDPVGINTTASKESLSYVSEVVYNEKIERVYAKIRRFVVVRFGDRSCTCLPLTTYNGKGLAKKGLRIEEHGLIYSSDRPSDALRLKIEAVKMALAKGAGHLKKNTYINYGRVYTVETNVKVKDVGQIETAFKYVLLRNYRQIFAGITDPGVEPDNEQAEELPLIGLGSGFSSMTSSHATTSDPYPLQGYTTMGYNLDGSRFDDLPSYGSSMPLNPQLHAPGDHTQNYGLDEGTSMFSGASYHQGTSFSALDLCSPSYPYPERLSQWNRDWSSGNMYQSHQVHAATYPQEEVEDDIVARAAILRPEK
jgi:hypothetical protein